MKADMASAQVDGAIAKNYALADAMGVQSTPSFVIGTDLLSGALSDDAFQKAIEAARGKGKAPVLNPLGPACS